MAWRKAQFKGKDVWIAVDPQGEPMAQGGRVSMRYSKSEGAKIYRAGQQNLKVDASSPIEDLPAGNSADAPKKRQSSGFGKAGTRTAQQKAMPLAWPSF